MIACLCYGCQRKSRPASFTNFTYLHREVPFSATEISLIVKKQDGCPLHFFENYLPFLLGGSRN